MPRIASSRMSPIIELSREEIIDQLLHFHGTFRLDFNREYLESLSDARLEHILSAARAHARKRNNT